MAAYPFGGHPTLAEYCHWARQHGCAVDCGVSVRGRRSVRMTRIVAPGGRWAVEVGTDDDDRLEPSAVGRLDRRLGLNSPFAKVSVSD